MVGGMFDRLNAGLAKTRDSLLGRVNRLVKAKSTIDDELLQDIEDTLLSADVGVQTTSHLLLNMKNRVREDKYVSPDELTGLLQDEIVKILHANGEKTGPGRPSEPKPKVVMIVGVNGAGKTTTVGKLAYQLRTSGRSVIVGAADTFRAAANEQLEIWARRAGVPLIQQKSGADPASVAFDTLSSALAQKADVVLIDTAGRLHTKTNLMEELQKIKRVLSRRMPGAPHEVLLVLDAGTGQNGLQQIRQFRESVGVTGLVLTKLDGTAKGGIILAASHEFQLPVKYVGIGEQIDDLQPFDRDAFVQALFSQP